MICRFPVGRLECAVVSDGQTEPPPEPALSALFTTGSGVPDVELAAAIAVEGGHRTTLTCGYNCLLIRTPDGAAVIDTGLGPHFPGYGPDVGPLVGKLHSRLAEAGSPPPGLADVAFTHLHQDHCRARAGPGNRRSRRRSAWPTRPRLRSGLPAPGWSTPWDHDPGAAALSRRRLLDQAVQENLLVHAYQLPFPGLGRIRRQHGAYVLRPQAPGA